MKDLAKKNTRKTSTQAVATARKTASARGLCITCVSRKPMAGKKSCKICTGRTMDVIATAREASAERGLCYGCLTRPRADRVGTRGRNAGQPVTRCEECLEAATLRAREDRARKKAASAAPKAKARK